MIGSISIGINRANFDNYKRSYKKLQALLAEIMSVLNIIFEIVRQILYFLSHKEMCKEIIGYILYEDKSHISANKRNNINLLKGKNDNSIFSEKNEIKNEFMKKINNNMKKRVNIKVMPVKILLLLKKKLSSDSYLIN